MKLPKLTKGCTKAVMGRAKQNDVYLYGAEFIVRLITDKHKELVSFIIESVDEVFPDNLTNQARATTAIALVLSAINATMEADDLEQQFGSEESKDGI